MRHSDVPACGLVGRTEALCVPPWLRTELRSIETARIERHSPRTMLEESVHSEVLEISQAG
jgi:hypothetical protein